MTQTTVGFTLAMLFHRGERELGSVLKNVEAQAAEAKPMAVP